MSTGNESGASALLATNVLAAADLSASQFLLATINTSGKLAVATTRGQRVHGVIADDPAAADRAAMLTYGGVMRVTAGGTFNPGVPLTTNASGQAIEATLSTDVVWGSAKEAGVSGAEVSAIVGVAGGFLTNPGSSVLEAFSDYAAAGAGKTIRSTSGAGVLATGTAGDFNVAEFTTGQKIGYYINGTQTLVALVDATGYVDISGDQTDNDGYELIGNQYPVSGAPIVVGESGAFFMTIGINFALANGTDDLFIGFRRRENVAQAAMLDYNTYFGLGNDTAASPMALKVREELNAAAGASTDTTDTQADAVDLFVKVLVSATGVATVQHGDSIATLAAPTATSAFTFDTGDPVVPIVRFLQATAAQTGVVKLLHWEVGLQ